MATVLTEGLRLGDLVKREIEPDLSRKRVTLKQGSGVLGLGAVLGIVTATKKYAPYDPTKVDGTEVAAAVLLQGGDTTAGDIPGLVVRSLAVLSTAPLVWSAGVTTIPHKTAAYAALETNHLICLDPA